MTARRKPERKHRLEAPHLSHTAGETYLNRRSIHAEGFDPDRRRRRLVEVAAHGGDAPCRGPQEEMTLRLRAVVDHGLHSPFVGEFEDAAGAFEREKTPAKNWTLEPLPNDGAAVRDYEGLGAERLRGSAARGGPAGRGGGGGDSLTVRSP